MSNLALLLTTLLALLIPLATAAPALPSLSPSVPTHTAHAAAFPTIPTAMIPGLAHGSGALAAQQGNNNDMGMSKRGEDEDDEGDDDLDSAPESGMRKGSPAHIACCIFTFGLCPGGPKCQV